MDPVEGVLGVLAEGRIGVAAAVGGQCAGDGVVDLAHSPYKYYKLQMIGISDTNNHWIWDRISPGPTKQLLYRYPYQIIRLHLMKENGDESNHSRSHSSLH